MNNENPNNQTGNTNPQESMTSASLGAAPVSPTPVAPNPSVAPASPSPAPTPTETPVTSAPAEAPAMENNPAPEVTSTPVGPMESKVPPVMPSQSNATSLGAIEQPIPGTNNYTATSNVNSNAFVEQNKTETVGVEPPAQNNEKQKKPMNKVLFVILIIALLAAVAYGVYYYLSLGKKAKVNVTPKDLELPINSTLPTELADYATLSGTDAKNCQLSTDAIDMATEGTYEYKIVCGNDTFTGHVTVINSVLPTATTKDVYQGISADGTNTIKVEDFIMPDTCSEADCTYAFDANVDISSYLKTIGFYEIPIKVTSASGKEGTVTGHLIVLNAPLKYMLSCNRTNEDGSVTTDRFAIGDTVDETQPFPFLDYAYRTTEFTFSDQESYQAAVGNKNEALTYNEVTGSATYDDANMKFQIRSDLTNDLLNSEYATTNPGGTFPRNYAGIMGYYAQKQYNCSVEK